MSSNTSGEGVSFAGFLTLLFIGLKLTKQIDWSWWWVLSPVWISIGITLIVVGGAFAYLAISDFISNTIRRRKHHKIAKRDNLECVNKQCKYCSKGLCHDYISHKPEARREFYYKCSRRRTPGEIRNESDTEDK